MSDEEDFASHSFETKLVIQLTVYTPKATTGRKARRLNPKPRKPRKQPSPSLRTTPSHRPIAYCEGLPFLLLTKIEIIHLKFLQCLPTKHGQNTTYKVSERKRFGFKYLYPASKVCITIGYFQRSSLTISVQQVRCH
jgi:hypothetical protein